MNINYLEVVGLKKNILPHLTNLTGKTGKIEINILPDINNCLTDSYKEKGKMVG